MIDVIIRAINDFVQILIDLLIKFRDFIIDFAEDMAVRIFEMLMEFLEWLITAIPCECQNAATTFNQALTSSINTIGQMQTLAYVLNRSGFNESIAIISTGVGIWVTFKIINFVRG